MTYEPVQVRKRAVVKYSPKRWGVKLCMLTPTSTEAMQWDGTEPSFMAINAWSGQKVKIGLGGNLVTDHHEVIVSGDWVMRGFKGAYIPCRPEEFDAVYEREKGDG